MGSLTQLECGLGNHSGHFSVRLIDVGGRRIWACDECANPALDLSLAPVPAPLDATDLAVFWLLVAAAEAGDFCPSNPVISDQVGRESGASASRAISRLEKAGLIRKEVGPNSRVVTIVKTGKRTKGEVAEAVHTARPPTRRRRGPAAPKILGPRVARDPCPRCGVRGDLGCSHRAMMGELRV